MKIRFGYTIGPEVTPAAFSDLVDALEDLGFDSVWVPEVLLAPTLDPAVALAHAAARTTRLKIGTHVILPGRNPVHLARQLAHLDALSGGRLLLLGVLGLAEEADTGAQGIDRAARGRAVDEMVPLLRRLWAGETVDHDGPMFPMQGISVSPTPVQQPLELWLAGQVPAALDRCGRLGDGWMPGLVFPHEAAAMRERVDAAAVAAGRTMDPEHYGANLFHVTDSVPDEALARLAARRSAARGAGAGDDVVDLVPVGHDALRTRVGEWVDAGFSKFLVRPLVPAADPLAELERLADEILPLTT